MKFSLFASLLGAAAAGGIASLGDYKIFESLAAAPTPWTLREDSHVDENKSFKLRIHLKNQNMASFQQKVIDAATPDHEEYGNHFSRVELRSMIAPKQESSDLVLQWLDSQGLSEKSRVDEDWIIVEGTVGDAERLLQTKYQWFENSQMEKLAVRTLSYSIPAALHAHVDIITPTIMFGGMAPQISTIIKEMQAPEFKAAQSSASDVHDGLDVKKCNVTITPDCLMALYKFKHFRGSRRNGNEIALAGFLEEYAQYDDLEQFLETYQPDEAGFTFSTQLINGGLNTQDNDPEYVGTDIGEANLDIQYGLALAYPTKTTYFSTGGRPPETTEEEVDNEPYLEFLTYLLKLDKIPQTISISYGDAEWTVPESYAHTVCDLFSQVTARGVTILASSGDSGSGSNCSATDPSKLLYTPALPASCPWVTAVGATRYVAPERAVSFSGGGFSDLFPRPSWQDATVTKYLEEKADPAFTQYYNTTGRAYPDVSAQGVYFETILNGTLGYLSGTSASAPAFAGVVALLNSDRISNGLAPFGFLNPWLYSKAASSFTDIVLGKGSGCSQVKGSGFAAVEGWDPVTGLGTPDFKKLRFVSTGIES